MGCQLAGGNSLGFQGLREKGARQTPILEFSRRFLLGASATPVRSTAEAVPYFAPLKASEQEEFAVLTLDGAGRPIRIHRVTKGLVDRSFVHPREAFLPAVRDNAVSIIVAHNHPSGNLEPSDADLEATRRLMQASRTLGIPMLDHLIVSRAGYVSLREQAPEAFRN